MRPRSSSPSARVTSITCAVEQVVAFLDSLRRRLEDTESDLLDTIEREDEISAASTQRIRQALDSVQRAFPGKDES